MSDLMEEIWRHRAIKQQLCVIKPTLRLVPNVVRLRRIGITIRRAKWNEARSIALELFTFYGWRLVLVRIVDGFVVPKRQCIKRR